MLENFKKKMENFNSSLYLISMALYVNKMSGKVQRLVHTVDEFGDYINEYVMDLGRSSFIGLFLS